MPTIIALDVSLSMQRSIPGRSDDNSLTYHQLAVKGINQFLDHLASNSRLEFVSLCVYSSTAEVVVDFTRDYDNIRQALKKIEHCDNTNLETMLKMAGNILSTNWGKQNYSQVLLFTDCGIGFGSGSSLKYSINKLLAKNSQSEYAWIPSLLGSKLNFICLGLMSDSYFVQATQIYQQYLDATGLKSHLFLPKAKEEHSEESKSNKSELGRTVMNELIDRMCDTNYKQFEASLKCGGYFRLECPILIWPPPLPHISQNPLGKDVVRIISKKLEICGFVALSDIGSPASVSRHLIIPKVESEKVHRKSSKSSHKTPVEQPPPPKPADEFEKMEQDIKAFYSKPEGDDEDSTVKHSQSESTKESACVLLHGALKIENMAALVLLNDDWFGFINSYADSKKKSNLMLNILPPGNNVIPWLGDLRMLGMPEDALPGENPNFPVKSEKRSYSQNCVVWIKNASLQSDILKVLRHAKKLPEKTPHFYKELNRIRRAALSIGFVELLEAMANIFENEVNVLPPNASPDCAIQLKHAAIELRKIANRDLKTLIIAQPTKYNQL